MLLSKNIEVLIRSNMATYYKEHGYDCKYGDKIIVDIKDLPLKSNLKVDVKCDYCGKKYQLRYSDFNKIVGKTCCQDCGSAKASNTNMDRYGTTCTLHNDEVRKKVIKTNIEKYNAMYPTQSKEIQNKISETNKEKYGVNCVLKDNKTAEKIKDTNIKKYGAENVFASDSVKKKIKKTNLKKYGFDNRMKDKEFARQVILKANQTKSENNSQTCSKQQKYICKIIGGELNYLFDNLWLDIFFKDKSIYFEVNYSGHDLAVKYKKITEHEFLLKEIKRYKFLKSKGLKQAIIQSKKDIIPNDNVLISIRNFAFYILNQDYDWVIFDIDNGFIKYKNNVIEYNFLTPFIF